MSRITAVVCCDYHSVPRPPGAVVTRPDAELPGGWMSVPAWARDPRMVRAAIRDAVADALDHDHPCDDAGCDIAAMRSQGLVSCAWHMLTGATEVPACDAVVAALVVNYGANAVREALGADLYRAPDWPAWAEHHDAYGRRCASCGSYTYAEAQGWGTWEPERCACCGVALPERPDDDD